MGSRDESAPVKSSKQTASTQETPTTPAYPDWSTSMQAYYGAGATPPPFFTSAVASSPTPHPYLWGSQFIPQYGTPLPYTAVYPHGGLYPYPNLAAAQGAAPITTETEGKGPNGKERVPLKKLKGTSGNMGVVDGKSKEGGKVDSGSGNDGASQSDASGSEGSSDTSNENTIQQEGTKKGGFDQMLADGANAQNNNTMQCSGVNLPVTMPGKPAVAMPATNLNIAMDLWNASPAGKVRPNASGVSSPVAPAAIVGREGVVPEHLWIQDERELKRQRRKQSNRESAKRSRLRKQAECEELQAKVEELSNENESLKTETKRLYEECSKLKSENASIKADLKRLYGTDVISTLEGNHANGQDTSRENNSIAVENGNLFHSNGNLESDPN